VVLVGGGVAAWAGTVLVYGQPLFGPLYLIGCLSYLTPAEWHGLFAAPGRLLRRLTGAAAAAPARKLGVQVGTRA
jgi:hypothetical protein